MLRTLLAGALALGTISCAPFAAHAQLAGATVVNACGTSALTIGAPAPLQMLANGNLCGNPGAGGGGTITGPLGTQTLAQSVAVTDLSLQPGGATYGLLAGPTPAQTSHGVNIGGVEGVSAAAAAASENPLSNGCTVATSAPTAGTNGQKAAAQCTPEGKSVVMPYAAPYAQLRGMVTLTSTTTATAVTGMGAQGAATYVHVTGCQIGRSDTGTTGGTLTFNDTATTVVAVPNGGNGGGNNPTFNPPLVLAANTGLTAQSSVSVSPGVTVACQGYVGGTQ